MSFTSELWQDITGIYDAILVHPFLTGLTDGSLPPGAFAFYVQQDALYLNQYAEALSAVSRRAPDPAARDMFARHAAGAIAVEQELHGSLLRDLGLTQATVAVTEPAPTTLAYTSHLLATAGGGTYADGVCAVLPCYWIYREVGQHLLGQGSPDPRYQRWIDTYGGEEFGEVVREVLAAADKLGDGLSPAEHARGRQHFLISSRYEWMFWDMGYRQEQWPV
ncbi:MAG TPA: thiaminase II [Streptosporangiaceae bacterium]